MKTKAAVLWEGAKPHDLLPRVTNGTGWVLAVAIGMSDTGVIAGYGRLNGVPSAFVLVPAQTKPPEREPKDDPRRRRR